MFNVTDKKMLLSLATAVAIVTMSGCTIDKKKTSSAPAPAPVVQASKTLAFAPVAVETTNQNAFSYTHSVAVDGVSTDVTYSELMRTGRTDNGEIFGGVKDHNGVLMTFGDGSPYICNGTNSGVGSGLDYTSILQKDNKLYMVSQFECSIGAMYMAELEQNTQTGVMTPKSGTLKFIDQSSEFGGWTHCAGMKTPWESHLGSEEYEPDARKIGNGSSDSYYTEVKKYWNQNASLVSPYYYGWATETKIANGTPDYAKHYNMGRFSHELEYVMPDSKTSYMTDDDTNVGLYMFIADTASDLSAGKLYAAKFEQTQTNKGGSFNLSWIDLGHASDSEIRAMVTTKPTFSDIFDVAEPLCADMCPTGFTSINTRTGHECLKVREGKELMASRLETRRYAAMKGATTELRKEEGIDYDPVHNRLYVAISEVTNGMTKSDTYDKGGSKDIALSGNGCGAIYALDIESDTTLGTNYKAKNFYAILYGETKDYTGTPYAGNSCDVNGISGPDNLTYIANSDTLIIAEDTSGHTNNMLWAYNVVSGDLTRIGSVPVGAEATSTFWYQNINDYSYMTFVTQHPSSAKESTVGVFSIKNALTSNLTTQTTQSDCEEAHKVWNSTLNQCFFATQTIDYTQTAPFDGASASGSCYTVGGGIVFGSDFECGLMQPWQTYSEASTANWVNATYGGDRYAYISGYGADEPSKDWLISPKLTLSGDEKLSFNSAKGYKGSDIVVYISKDYTGSGNPRDATWTKLNATIASSEVKNYLWTASGDIDLSAYAGDAYIAFYHEAPGTTSNQVANWEVDDIVIKGSGSATVPFQAEFTMSQTTALTIDYAEFKSSVSAGVRPYTYSWNMGDGTTKTEESFCYRYTTAGNFNVTLNVTDKEGAVISTEAKAIKISNPINEQVPANDAQLRVATFNSYLNRTTYGKLYSDLVRDNDTQVKNVAHIIQMVKPDIILINEFDYNGSANVDLLIQNYLNVAQGDADTIDYPYYYVAPSNTGTPTGLDINNNGVIGAPGSGQAYGDDSYGFGEFEGQYAMVVLSKYPIESANIRTFTHFLWKDMPSANLPTKNGSSYYIQQVLDIYRLSSKNHWDIPVNVNGKIIHVLASHPTPPTFDDGDKDVTASAVDWNGLRNHDEIRLWADYVSGENYMYDDNNNFGGMEANTRFVILGDQNADPDEGDSYQNAIMQFLSNPYINASVTPKSKGATSEGVAKREYDDTANWSMRADYVLPSLFGFEIDDCHVFWPELSDVKHYLMEQNPNGENSSDHRLVWCDLNITDANGTRAGDGGTGGVVSSLTTNFNTGTFEGWTPKSYSSTKDWTVATYGTPLLKVTGYGDSSAVSDDWIVSPELTFVNGQTLTFDNVLNHTGSTCRVLVSTDYNGAGDPASATWTTLATYTASAGNFTLVSSGAMSLSAFAGNNGYIAFRHTNAVVGTSGTWEVDNIVVIK